MLEEDDTFSQRGLEAVRKLLSAFDTEFKNDFIFVTVAATEIESGEHKCLYVITTCCRVFSADTKSTFLEHLR